MCLYSYDDCPAFGTRARHLAAAQQGGKDTVTSAAQRPAQAPARKCHLRNGHRPVFALGIGRYFQNNPGRWAGPGMLAPALCRQEGELCAGLGPGLPAWGQPSYLLAGSSGRAHSPREGGATVTLIFLRGPRAPRIGGVHCPGSLCGRARGRPGSRASQPLLLPHAGAASSPKNPQPPRTWGADGDMGTGVPDPLPLDRH